MNTKSKAASKGLQQLSATIQSKVFDQCSSNYTGTSIEQVDQRSAIIAQDFTSVYLPKSKCNWAALSTWCFQRSETLHGNNITDAQCQIPHANIDGSEEAALKNLGIYLNNDSNDQSHTSNYTFASTLPEEFEGQGVARLLPFIREGTLSSCFALCSLQRLGLFVVQFYGLMISNIFFYCRSMIFKVKSFL